MTNENPLESEQLAQAHQRHLEKRGLERHLGQTNKAESDLGKIPAFENLKELIDEGHPAAQSGKVSRPETNRFGVSPSKTELTQKIKSVEEQLDPQEEKKFQQEGFQKIVAFARKMFKTQAYQKDIRARLNKLYEEVYKNPNLKENPEVWKMFQQANEAIASSGEELRKSSRENPASFLSYWILTLRKYKDQYEKFGIIETDEIAEKTSKLFQDAHKKMEKTNGVIALLGGTGTGKTATARYLAEQLSPDGKYEFVSAHSQMLPSDLLYRLGITVEKIEPGNVPEMIEKAKAKLKDRNLSPEEFEAESQVIEEVIKNQASQKTFQTQVLPEAVVRAATEGRKIVIDEFNYLPEETLASLNAFLDTRPGNMGRLQIGSDEKEVMVKDGFGVILTGNIGKSFLKRKSLDPALVNRIGSGIIEWDAVGQEFDKSFQESIIDGKEIDEGKKSPQRNLFTIGLTQLLDSKSNLAAPASALEKVWNLSESFALIQAISSGKDYRSLGLDFMQGSTSYNFDKFFLSFRNFNNVLRQWKLEGYDKSLDCTCLRI